MADSIPAPPPPSVDLEAIKRSYELIGWLVTSIDVDGHDPHHCEAVDRVWRAVPLLIAEVERLRGRDRRDAPAWQDIETAPKDGTSILGCNSRGVFIFRWNTDEYARRVRPYWDSYGYVWGTTALRSDQPTHWMPLPEPPTPQQESK